MSKDEKIMKAAEWFYKIKPSMNVTSFPNGLDRFLNEIIKQNQ